MSLTDRPLLGRGGEILNESWARGRCHLDLFLAMSDYSQPFPFPVLVLPAMERTFTRRLDFLSHYGQLQDHPQPLTSVDILDSL